MTRYFINCALRARPNAENCEATGFDLRSSSIRDDLGVYVHASGRLHKLQHLILALDLNSDLACPRLSQRRRMRASIEEGDSWAASSNAL